MCDNHFQPQKHTMTLQQTSPSWSLVKVYNSNEKLSSALALINIWFFGKISWPKLHVVIHANFTPHSSIFISNARINLLHEFPSSDWLSTTLTSLQSGFLAISYHCFPRPYCIQLRTYIQYIADIWKGYVPVTLFVHQIFLFIEAIFPIGMSRNWEITFQILRKNPFPPTSNHKHHWI